MNSNTWIAMAVAVGMWAGPASAEEDVVRATSEARFREGLAAIKEGNCEQARVNFLQMLSLEPGNPNVLLNLAISEQCTKHSLEALRHLKEFRVNPKADQTTDHTKIQELYADLWKATGHLKISADQDAAIGVDGEASGRAPLADVVDVQPGNHLVASKGRTVRVTVAAGETKEVNLASQDSGKNYWTPEHLTGVSLGAAAVVAAGLGIGFLAAHNSRASGANGAAADSNACRDLTSPACQSYHSAVDSAKNAKTGEIVSFVAAGALAVGAVVLLVPWQFKKEGARVRARLVPTGQGVLLDGAF